MVSYTVTQNEHGKTVERILLSHFAIDRNQFFKALRKKDVKINGVRISENIPLREHDLIEAYLTPKEGRARYTTVYENDYILIVSKRQGVPVASDKNRELSLIASVNQDFHANFELCHRIDRNTGGLVLLSKDKRYTEAICSALQGERRYYEKRYSCIVYGDARPYIGVQRAWLFKDSKRSKVYVYGEKRQNTKEILTEIRSASYDGKQNISTLEINLITGRTHQIRAHLAFLGLPIVGDGKYGSNTINKQFSYRYQALWACAFVPNHVTQELRQILPDIQIESEPHYE